MKYHCIDKVESWIASLQKSVISLIWKNTFSFNSIYSSITIYMRDRSLPMIPSQCCTSVVQRKRCKEFIFCLTHLQTLVVCLNIMLSILRIFPFLTEVDTRLIRNFDIFVVIRHLHQNGRISALFWMYNANAIYINQLICFEIKTLEHFGTFL